MRTQMLPRRTLIIGLLSVVVVAVPATSASATTIAELKEQLRFGLQARLPEEFAFIDRILLLVEQGQVPMPLVQSTFQWARKKRPYPFQFFKRGLILRGAQQGIVIAP
jgi:hypothetical protein